MQESLRKMVRAFDDVGNGIVEWNDLKVLVPGVAPGDEITFKILHRSPHQPVAWGEVVRIHTHGRLRKQADCDIAAPTRGRCGGCPVMHLSDEGQELCKVGRVKAAFDAFGLTTGRLSLIRGKSRLHYRNRADFVAARTRKGIVFGSYESRSHRVIAMPNCSVLRYPISLCANYIRSCANRLNTPVHSPDSVGLRYVSLFANADGDVLVDFVVSGPDFSAVRPLAEALKAFKNIKGVAASLNNSPNNALRVAASNVLWGEFALPEKIGDVTIMLSAGSFTQLNSEVLEMIYENAREIIPFKPNHVLDLYCGSGAFGRAVKPLSTLCGAEFSETSVKLARLGDTNPAHRFLRLDLGRDFPEDYNPDLILVNPPRRGLSDLIVSKLKTSGKNILYMSCEAKSMARDITMLAESHTLAVLRLFDMLPQTTHVECLALLVPG